MVQYGLGSIRREHASRASRLALETQRSPDVAALDDTQPPRTHALSGDGASWVFGGPGGRMVEKTVMPTRRRPMHIAEFAVMQVPDGGSGGWKMTGGSPRIFSTRQDQPEIALKSAAPMQIWALTAPSLPKFSWPGALSEPEASATGGLVLEPERRLIAKPLLVAKPET